MHSKRPRQIPHCILQAVIDCGNKFVDEGHSNSDDIKTRVDGLQEKWDELESLAKER